ncbi:MAG: FAD-binding oxidoreductase [Enterococcus gilvus]
MGKNLYELPHSLKEIAIFPEDPRYDTVRSNDYKVGQPKIILLAETEEQVSEAITYAASVKHGQEAPFPFSVRSGGHGLSATSVNDGGLILDLSKMNQITVVDKEKGLVRIQSGALWGDVATKLHADHLVLSSGDHGDTGVGGLAVSGGMGTVVRAMGLTIDCVVGATIITADGEKHVVDAAHEPELFWGIRGGGGQFGVVTEFLFQADTVVSTNPVFTTPIIVQTISYTVTDLFEFIQAWHGWFKQASNQLTSIMLLNRGADQTVTVQARNFWYGEETPQAKEVLAQALQLSDSTANTEVAMNYADFFPDEHARIEGKNTAFGKNTLVADIPYEIVAEMEKLLEPDFVYGIELRALGGAVNEKTSDFNAWSFRDAEIMIAYWFNKDSAAEAIQLFQPILEFGQGVYGAYSSDTSHEETMRVWSVPTANKLRGLKQQYDPMNVFTENREA